jgi:hypothetical protein
MDDLGVNRGKRELLQLGEKPYWVTDSDDGNHWERADRLGELAVARIDPGQPISERRSRSNRG